MTLHECKLPSIKLGDRKWREGSRFVCKTRWCSQVWYVRATRIPPTFLAWKMAAK